MAIKQISVYLENKPGTLAKIIRNISDAGINIRALSLADTAEFGILRLITEDVERAVELLSEKTIVRLSEVLAVKMDDQSGGLGAILDVLEETRINIEYMYAFAAPDQSAYAVFRVDDAQSAEDYLNIKGIVTLQNGDLQNLLEVKK